jgi:hypothetical protein
MPLIWEDLGVEARRIPDRKALFACTTLPGGTPGQLDADAREWAAARRAVVLAITAQGRETPVGPGCTLVEDLDGVLPVPRRPAVTIVRPDRFLLGTLPAPLTTAQLAGPHRILFGNPASA